MDKRRSKRTIFNLEATLVSRSLNFKGIIQDFADDGICIHIHEEQSMCQLLHGMLFEVEFVLHSGEKIDLQCEVIRTQRQSVDARENIVGMKIINQPPEYRAFMETLS